MIHLEIDGTICAVEFPIKLPHHLPAPVIALDEALKRLEELDPRKSKIVELRFFGGLSVEETAEALHISGVTVMREWSMAKAWLYNSLNNED
jgi:DNA-directed RNA polymerase specialized sigma24 family protein